VKLLLHAFAVQLTRCTVHQSLALLLPLLRSLLFAAY
jgi:hypothetical protein